MTAMDNKRTRQPDWPQAEVEAFRRLLAARGHPDSEQRPTGEADQPADPNASLRRPPVSLFEPDPPNPTSAVAPPPPAGSPQLVTAPATRRRRLSSWLRLIPVLTLALGLSGVGFVLGSTWTARTLHKPQAAPAPLTQPTSVTATSIVLRQVATPACLEAAKRGDELIALLINNQRSRAAKRLVPYHVASRQCARDAGP
jgi:hypothetical protein